MSYTPFANGEARSSVRSKINTQFETIFNTLDGLDLNDSGRLNVTYFTGPPDTTTYTKDVTAEIQEAIDYIVGLEGSTRPSLYFPPGVYFISDTLDFSGMSGWTILGVQSRSIIAVKPSETIDGPMFNFNLNSSTIRSYNSIHGLYFFSDATMGTAKQVVDFSYNNRFGMYQCRTSRISTETDIAVNFAYEGIFSQCNFSGGRSLNRYSNGISMADEANAILMLQCSIDNYKGTGTIGEEGYIEGAGVIFEGSKGMTLDTCTMQQCDYGVQLGSGAKAAMITGGGYWEGNIIADIRLGNGVTGSIYDTLILGNSVKSGSVGTTAGILFDKADIYGLTVLGTQFDNDDPIQINSRANQSLQDITFQNVRTGDTIYSFRNMIDTSQIMYMDNIKVINPGTPFNAIQTPTFTPTIGDSYMNFAADFDTWKDGSDVTVDFIEQDGTWLGSPVWKKNTTDIENMFFELSDLSGFKNQIVTFSCWIKFDGTINANDLIQIENQTLNTKRGASRPLRPGALSTTEFVKIYVYGLVDSSDTKIRVRILTRDQNIYFTKPELKLGFV